MDDHGYEPPLAMRLSSTRTPLGRNSFPTAAGSNRAPSESRGSRVVGADGHLSDAECAELAAFADGSLPAGRRAQVADRVARSPELAALVGEQRAALDAVRGVDVVAPAGLHARLRTEPSRQAPRSRPVLLTGAVALAVLLVVLLVPGGAGEPTVLEVAGLADRGPSAPAPARDPVDPTLLAASVAGVPFPAYGPKLGWHASGARADELHGRDTRTVFYAHGRRRVAYSIVSADALAWPAGARRTVLDGIALRYLRRHGQTIVTWLRAGHTCVLTATDVPRAELLELAVWDGKDRAAAES